MAIIIPSMLPKNAAGGWSASCSFWRSNGVCPSKLVITNTRPLTVTTGVAGWWSGLIGYICTGTDTYVTGGGTNTVSIDVWKALADGIWSSSTVFTVYSGNILGAVPWSFSVGPELGSTPAAQTKPGLGIFTGAVCPSNVLGTVTVYDDGTFSFV